MASFMKRTRALDQSEGEVDFLTYHKRWHSSIVSSLLIWGRRWNTVNWTRFACRVVWKISHAALWQHIFKSHGGETWQTWRDFHLFSSFLWAKLRPSLHVGKMWIKAASPADLWNKLNVYRQSVKRTSSFPSTSTEERFPRSTRAGWCLSWCDNCLPALTSRCQQLCPFQVDLFLCFFVWAWSEPVPPPLTHRQLQPLHPETLLLHLLPSVRQKQDGRHRKLILSVNRGVFGRFPFTWPVDKVDKHLTDWTWLDWPCPPWVMSASWERTKHTVFFLFG